MSTLNLKIPESLYRQLQELAEQEGVSVDRIAVMALAEKISALMTSEYLDQRARRGSRSKFDDALSRVRDEEPDQHDEL